MIEVKSLVRNFGAIKAVDDISFVIPKGQILGFLGPNGAGKSTTMKMLACYLQPSQGTALIEGHDIKTNSLEVRRSIGYLPESCPLYGEMTVLEFLSFIGEVRELRAQQLKDALMRVREICELKQVWTQAIDTLSKGYRQRVGFAQALIHDPPVLILDEPTDGLDPNQKFGVRKLIQEMGRSKTIILSTHILEEVEAVCQRAIIIAQGKIMADATPFELRERSHLHNSVVVTFKDEKSISLASSHLRNLGSIQDVQVEGNSPQHTLRVLSKNKTDIYAEVANCLSNLQVQAARMHVEKGRLDDVFREVTKLN